MALGQDYYSNDAYNDFYNLSRSQSNQSLSAGDRAASYADPFMEERKNQIERLRTLQSNPGSITTSPFYKFLMDTQMNAVNANNAARGLSRSGRGAMALQDRAAGVASQAYFPLLENASRLAVSGSSPSAAGLAYTRGVERSQDQRQVAEASRTAGRSPAPGGGGYNPNTASWDMMNRMPVGGYQNTGLPSGGATPYSGSGGYTGSAYTPSAGAGTGYIEGSGGGRADFGGGSFTTNGVPLIQPGDYTQSSGGYYSEPYSDFGGGDYYGDYGGESYGGDYYGGE